MAPAWTRRLSPRRWRDLVLLVILVVVVNLPMLTVLRAHHRIAADGVEVTAEVTGANPAGPGLTFRFDQATDPAQVQWPAEVTRTTFAAAVRTHRVQVRVVPGHPSEHRVDGEVVGHGYILFTVITDLVILMIVLLVWRFRVLVRRDRREEEDADQAS